MIECIYIPDSVSMVPLFCGVISPQGPKIDPSFLFSGETSVSSPKDERYNVLVDL